MAQLKLKVLIEAVDRLTAPIRKIARSLRVELPSAARIGGQALKGLAGLAGKALTAMTGLAALSWGGLTGGAIRTGAKFEQFAAVLETLEGNSEKARASMQWVEEFAKTTPYELDEVMEAFVALRSYGIDPTDGTLKTLGNTASAMNKDLMQAVEMFADAQTGEFERLKEFGVRGSAAGDQVRLTYQRAGKEVVATSKKSGDAIRRNLLGIFDSRFEGAMEKQSKTFNGLWSNLMDMLTSFQRKVADAGLFDFVKGELQGLLDLVTTAAANGKLDEWAAQISASLVELLVSLKKLLTEVNWVEFTNGVIKAANGFAKFMHFIGGLEGLITNGVGVAIGWVTSLLLGCAGAIAAFLGIAVAPVALVIAALGLVALAGWYLFRNWEDIWAALKAGWKGFVDWLGGLGKWLSDAFKLAIAMVWATFPAWFRAAITGGGMIIKAVTHAVGGGGSGGGGNRPTAPQPNIPGRGANGGLAVTVTTRHEGPPRVTARATGNAVQSLVTDNRRGGGVD
ncbi:tape measure protein [Brevundimonas sp.]|uniref:tape measure protein n=1 Tax=Brevundimonas sp. TaxID=1871086 RepID=UPI003F71D61A